MSDENVKGEVITNDTPLKKIVKRRRRPPPSISPGEAKILKNHIEEGMPLDRAVMEAGYQFSDKAIARDFGQRVLVRNKRLNQDYIESLQKRVTPDVYTDMLTDAMTKATKMVKVGRDEYTEVPDYDVRLKAGDQFRDVVGLRAPKEIKTTSLSLEEVLIQLSIEDGNIVDLGDD